MTQFTFTNRGSWVAYWHTKTLPVFWYGAVDAKERRYDGGEWAHDSKVHRDQMQAMLDNVEDGVLTFACAAAKLTDEGMMRQNPKKVGVFRGKVEKLDLDMETGREHVVLTELERVE